MRAPVAVACNRIISAESDTRLEGGGGRGRFPGLLLLEKDPLPRRVVLRGIIRARCVSVRG